VRFGDLLPHERGDGRANFIDFLTTHPEARRQIVRLLGESTRARHGSSERGDARGSLPTDGNNPTSRY
jgi:hypothetical protein